MAFAIDLHVHTRRYSPCAEFCREEELGVWGRRAGLAGLVITDHDVLWPSDELEALRNRVGGDFRLFRGIECTVTGAHAVVVGLDDLGPITKGCPLETVLETARNQGAAVILAHPYREGDPGLLPADQVDAVEVASTSFSADEAERSRTLARRLGKPMVASSDGHALSVIGWAFTEFPDLPADEKELARCIREGLGRVVAPRPFPS